jgi:hypothetical protein
VAKKFRFTNIFFYLFVFLLFGEITFSQNKPTTNYEAIAKKYSEMSENIVNNIPAGYKTVNLIIEGDSNKWVFQSELSRILKTKEINLSDKNDSSVCLIKIFNETKIRYSKDSNDNDSFIRNIFCLSVISNGEKDKFERTYTEMYCDTLKINDISYINNSKIKITTINLEEQSIFDSLLKPLIILSSSGVLVYLLFTVRSK